VKVRHSCLNLTAGSELSAERFYSFTPHKRSLVSIRYKDSEGATAGVDVKTQRKIPAPAGNRTLVVQSTVRSLKNKFRVGWKIYH